MAKRIVLFSSVFFLLLFAGTAGAASFSSSGGLLVESSSSDDLKAAGTYPLPIEVSGLAGTISNVTVRINGLVASDPSYLQMLVVSPNGTPVTVFSRVATYGPGTATNRVNLVFDQSYPNTIPYAPLHTSDDQTVFFKPTRGGSNSDAYPNLPPNLDSTPDLTRFNGVDPNGTWKLYVVHAYSPGYRSATITNWSLDIASVVPRDVTAPTFSKTSVLGRTIGFDLSEAASVQYRVSRLSDGVKVRSKCLAKKKGRSGKKCTRATLLPGAIASIGSAGVNTFTFGGKLNGKKLSPGRYRLTAIATDSVGNASSPQSFTVTIKKPKKKKPRGKAAA